MIDQERNQANARARARELCWWERVDQMSATDYLVDSTSRRGVAYLVQHVGTDRWTCSCPAGQRGISCVHIAATFYARARWETPKRPAAHPADSAITAARARGPRCSVDDEAPSFGELLAGVR